MAYHFALLKHLNCLYVCLALDYKFFKGKGYVSSTFRECYAKNGCSINAYWMHEWMESGQCSIFYRPTEGYVIKEHNFTFIIWSCTQCFIAFSKSLNKSFYLDLYFTMINWSTIQNDVFHKLLSHHHFSIFLPFTNICHTA